MFVKAIFPLSIGLQLNISRAHYKVRVIFNFFDRLLKLETNNKHSSKHLIRLIIIMMMTYLVMLYLHHTQIKGWGASAPVKEIERWEKRKQVPLYAL